MLKGVFFSKLQEGKRNRDAPRKRYKDQLKKLLAQAGISHQSWQQEALDRDSWRSSVRKASCEFAAERHKAAKEKCRRQKQRAASLSPSTQTFVCPSAIGCAHQESVSTATNEPIPSSARNEPSLSPVFFFCLLPLLFLSCLLFCLLAHSSDFFCRKFFSMFQ